MQITALNFNFLDGDNFNVSPCGNNLQHTYIYEAQRWGPAWIGFQVIICTPKLQDMIAPSENEFSVITGSSPVFWHLPAGTAPRAHCYQQIIKAPAALSKHRVDVQLLYSKVASRMVQLRVLEALSCATCWVWTGNYPHFKNVNVTY